MFPLVTKPWSLIWQGRYHHIQQFFAHCLSNAASMKSEAAWQISQAFGIWKTLNGKHSWMNVYHGMRNTVTVLSEWLIYLEIKRSQGIMKSNVCPKLWNDHLLQVIKIIGSRRFPLRGWCYSYENKQNENFKNKIDIFWNDGMVGKPLFWNRV